MARPISKISNMILALKPGKEAVMPRGAKQATIASYVYNANARLDGKGIRFSTTRKAVKGRKMVVVQCSGA